MTQAPQRREIGKDSVSPATREQVCRAALEAFDSFGITHLKVEDVARLAGVSRQTVYRIFPQRESLVGEIVVRIAQELNAHIHGSVSTDQPLNDALVAVMRESIAQYRAHPHLHSMVDPKNGNLIATYSLSSERLRDAFIDRWRPYLEAANARGELRESLDLPQVTRWLSITNSYFYVNLALFGGDDAWEEYYRTFVVPALLKGA